jgi:hypothetical protein
MIEDQQLTENRWFSRRACRRRSWLDLVHGPHYLASGLNVPEGVPNTLPPRTLKKAGRGRPLQCKQAMRAIEKAAGAAGTAR